MGAQPARGWSGWLELFCSGISTRNFPQAGSGSLGFAAPLQSHSQVGFPLQCPWRQRQDYSTALKITLIWSLPCGESELWTEMRSSFGIELLLFLTCNKIKNGYLNVTKIQLFNWNSQTYFMYNCLPFWDDAESNTDFLQNSWFWMVSYSLLKYSSKV